MEYKIYSNITCPSRRCNGKYWTRSSLLRNLLNVEHHAPYKSMYSKYQIIKSSDLFHLKYWYNNTPYLERPCLPDNFCQILPCQLKPLFNTILIMFLIGFVLPNFTTGHHKDWIYQTICQAKPSKFFIKLYTDHNTLLVKHPAYQKIESFRAASLPKLDNTVNNNAIFYIKYVEFFRK